MIGKTLVIALCWLLTVEAMAAEAVYQIELWVFKQNQPSDELFDQTISRIVWPADWRDSSSWPAVPVDKQQLPKYAAALQSGGNYPTLLTAAWSQAIIDNGLSTVRLESADHQVNGYVRIQRGQNLSLLADIEYKTDGLIYRIEEKRLLKLHELNYFDHPKFGLLALIVPIDRR